MLYRRLGRTGAQVSAIGIGGHHLGDAPIVDEAIRLVHEAIDAGVGRERHGYPPADQLPL
jgi:aryl-alcohol dehydrogenase-like predicted oxidoreductase